MHISLLMDLSYNYALVVIHVQKSSTSKPDNIKPRLVPRVSPGPSTRYTHVSSPKGSGNKANVKVHGDQVRSKAEKKTSGDPHKHRILSKTTKYEVTLVYTSKQDA